MGPQCPPPEPDDDLALVEMDVVCPECRAAYTVVYGWDDALGCWRENDPLAGIDCPSCAADGIPVPGTERRPAR